MATGTVYIDGSLKDKERGTVLVFGRVLVGQNATIRPQDLGLRTVRAIGFSPWLSQPLSMVQGNAAIRAAVMMAGSIGSLGVLDTSIAAATPLGNYVRVQSYRLTGTGLGGASTGTFRLGTVAGSVRASYWAIGH